MASMAHAAAEGHVDIHGLYLPLETMLGFMAHADAGDHVDVCGLSRGHKPCATIIHAPTNKRLSAMVLMTADSQLRKLDIKFFCENPNSPSKK